jgi:hypothetical protein
MTDQDFSTALLGAFMREAGALSARGIGMLSSQMQSLAPQLEQFVLVRCKPLGAHLYFVHPDGAPHEYYRETGDELSDGFADIVNQFVTTGMNELSVADRQRISHRLEQEGIGLGILIEGGTSIIRGLALPRGGDLAGSEELFRLELDRAPPSV